MGPPRDRAVRFPRGLLACSALCRPVPILLMGGEARRAPGERFARPPAGLAAEPGAGAEPGSARVPDKAVTPQKAGSPRQSQQRGQRVKEIRHSSPPAAKSRAVAPWGGGHERSPAVPSLALLSITRWELGQSLTSANQGETTRSKSLFGIARVLGVFSSMMGWLLVGRCRQQALGPKFDKFNPAAKPQLPVQQQHRVPG